MMTPARSPTPEEKKIPCKIAWSSKRESKEAKTLDQTKALIYIVMIGFRDLEWSEKVIWKVRQNADGTLQDSDSATLHSGRGESCPWDEMTLPIVPHTLHPAFLGQMVVYHPLVPAVWDEVNSSAGEDLVGKVKCSAWALLT